LLAPAEAARQEEACVHEHSHGDLPDLRDEIERAAPAEGEELRRTLERYESALSGANVIVFTHDRQLRYTSVSGPLFGREPADIIGRTDDDVLPLESRGAVLAVKREAIEHGAASDCEISISQSGTIRWLDLHIEPLRDGGGIAGLTCAAVDITERKENEAHLRLLMRELTHRSKNLLAVIQSMARQTARNVGSVDRFVDQFSARLQALANSHDLLVQESWHGASLPELVRLELGPYAARAQAQVLADGPDIVLKPEAAQSLGLALHELAENAAKYGALSSAQGRVALTWRRLPASEGHGVELIWAESEGPSVRTPERRGFGTLVIERNLARSLDAEVDLSFPPGGVRCRVVIPLTQLSVSR
jgi:PAS domain S-box-containing protein